MVKYGADARLRVFHSCTDEFPICKVALNTYQRQLLQDKSFMPRRLSSQDVLVVLHISSRSSMMKVTLALGWRLVDIDIEEIMANDTEPAGVYCYC